MNIFVTILTALVSNVEAGKTARCTIGVGIVSAGLSTGCSAMTAGLGTVACAAGGSAIGAVAWSGCFGEISKRDIVIDPTAFKQTKHAYCTDFGPDYGFECVKPRHVKKLGDLVIHQPCTKPENLNIKKCVGTKFYATCEGQQWKPYMCKLGHECSQADPKNASCVPI